MWSDYLPVGAFRSTVGPLDSPMRAFPRNEECARGAHSTTGKVQIQWNLVSGEHPLLSGRMA